MKITSSRAHVQALQIITLCTILRYKIVTRVRLTLQGFIALSHEKIRLRFWYLFSDKVARGACLRAHLFLICMHSRYTQGELGIFQLLR